MRERLDAERAARAVGREPRDLAQHGRVARQRRQAGRRRRALEHGLPEPPVRAAERLGAADGPRAERLDIGQSFAVECRAVPGDAGPALGRGGERLPVAGAPREHRLGHRGRRERVAAERLEAGDVVVARCTRDVGVQADVVGGVRPGVERQRRAEEERHDGCPDRDGHVHRARIARHQHVRALEERAEAGDRAPAAGVDRERAERPGDLFSDAPIPVAATENEPGADRRVQRAGDIREVRRRPAPDVAARAQLERDQRRAIGLSQELRGPASCVRRHVEEELPRSGGDAGHALVVVDEVERRLAPREAARGEEPRPRMRDQPVSVGAHRPATRVRSTDELQQHGAHLRARVVERQVEALGAERADGVIHEPVGLAEPVARLAEQQPPEPVEVELPDAVDTGQTARDVGEVALDEHDDLGAGMLLTQAHDGGRRLQEVSEARQVDDEDLPHARCSRT